jgi:hypothetical protein
MDRSFSVQYKRLVGSVEKLNASSGDLQVVELQFDKLSSSPMAGPCTSQVPPTTSGCKCFPSADEQKVDDRQ